MNGNLSNKDVFYVHVMISDIKGTSHHAVIITNYAIWHQSLKSIHYRILLIFQTKKTTDLRVKTWGGDTYPPSPRDLRPWCVGGGGGGGGLPPFLNFRRGVHLPLILRKKFLLIDHIMLLIKLRKFVIISS